MRGVRGVGRRFRTLAPVHSRFGGGGPDSGTPGSMKTIRLTKRIESFAVFAALAVIRGDHIGHVQNSPDRFSTTRDSGLTPWP